MTGVPPARADPKKVEAASPAYLVCNQCSSALDGVTLLAKPKWL